MEINCCLPAYVINLKNGLHFLVCIFWCAFSTRLHGNCISAILLYVSESGNEGQMAFASKIK